MSHPGIFVSGNDPEVSRSADHVMLTHGWSRFTWNEILTNSKPNPLFVPEHRGHIIRAKVTNPDGTPSVNSRTYLSSPAKNIQVYGSSSDALGDVKYEMKDFYGPRKIIAQTNTRIDSTSRIRILSPFSEKYSTTHSLATFNFSPAIEKQLISRSIGMQVQDIFYQEKSNQFKKTTVDTTAFYGKADATYYLDDYTRFPVMEEVMREYVPGVLVRKRKDGFHFMNLDVVNKTVFDEDPIGLTGWNSRIRY